MFVPEQLQSPEPTPHEGRRSIAWRCGSCSRYLLFEELAAKPPHCQGCDGTDLAPAGPDTREYRE